MPDSHSDTHPDEAAHEPAIAVEGLTVSLGRATILRDVSFAVSRGEYVSIIGPNGAGKTTLLRTLLRRTRFERGDVRILGRSLSSLSQVQLARRVAYVPQAETTSIPFTVEAFVAMARYPYGGPFKTPTREDRQAVDDALRTTAVEHLRYRRLDTLSGGERRKVFVAAAVAQQAPLLLLDEPTTYLDYKHRHEIQELLVHLNREQGVTVLTVTHDLNGAVLAGERIIAMREGSVVFDGPPERLMEPERLQAIYDTPLPLVAHPTAKLPLVVPPQPGGRP
ncbi:MAG: ABC transporter ATP-binding protein [Planctomycetota bacterium]|nr:MAG: ABC transporter ATP-binding protein [Planctomycetota bacterium]